MKKIKILNFSIPYTKYLSNLSKKIATNQIHVEHFWCKSMKYWEPSETETEMFREVKMRSISIPIKNDSHGRYEEHFSFEFLLYLIKKKSNLLIIDSNLISSFLYMFLAKLLKIKIISLTTNFPDTSTKWGRISDKILRFNDFLVDHYVVPSTTKKENMIKLKIKPSKITCIGHGVDIEKFRINSKKIPVNIPCNKKIILSIGRFNIKKGKKYVIESFQEVKKQVDDAFLVIIGNGPEKENIINLIKKMNLEDSVLLIDIVDNSLMPDYYSSADVIVIPTIEPEPFGPIYLESMASGSPIVAFSVGGGEKDLIQNKINGILVKTRDVKEMSNAIVELLNDDEKRKSMGAYSRKIIQENYTYEILAEKWRSVIRGLVNINNKTELN